MQHRLVWAAGLFGLAAVCAALFVFSGVYNVGADSPHWPATYKVLETFRDRSIASRASTVKPPDLEDPQLILKGAGQYSAMCVSCHLAPGSKESEIRPGLYPQPPDLSLTQIDPRFAFWVIKHGVKMSAMPAWGATHDDPTIWSMVAFLGKLPKLTPAEYEDIVKRAPPDEEMSSMHSESDKPEHAVAGHGHASEGAMPRMKHHH